jgi:hypothetical protein
MEIKNLVLVIIALVLSCILFAATAHCQDLPDNPAPVCQRTIIDENAHITYVTIPCENMPKTEWHTLPPPKHHNWFYRHPLLTSAIIVGAVGGIVASTRQWGCPSHIDGYPYDGTPPCPKSCEADGCYWGPGSHRK